MSQVMIVRHPDEENEVYVDRDTEILDFDLESLYKDGFPDWQKFADFAEKWMKRIEDGEIIWLDMVEKILDELDSINLTESHEKLPEDFPLEQYPLVADRYFA